MVDGALLQIPTDKINKKVEMDRHSDETVDESPIGILEPKPVLNMVQSDMAKSNTLN